MPKTKTTDLHKIYRRDTIDKMLFGWIACGKHFNPELSYDEIITSFCERFYPDLDVESARSAYSRMVREYRADKYI